MSKTEYRISFDNAIPRYISASPFDGLIDVIDYVGGYSSWMELISKQQ